MSRAFCFDVSRHQGVVITVMGSNVAREASNALLASQKDRNDPAEKAVHALGVNLSRQADGVDRFFDSLADGHKGPSATVNRYQGTILVALTPRMASVLSDFIKEAAAESDTGLKKLADNLSTEVAGAKEFLNNKPGRGTVHSSSDEEFRSGDASEAEYLSREPA